MDKPKDHHDKEGQVDGEQAPQAKPIDSCINHLLILAQSAEIAAQSEDSLVGLHIDNQNEGSNNNLVDQVSQDSGSNVMNDGQKHPPEVLDTMSVYSHESSPRSGFCYEVIRPRLTQIRKQARLKYLLLDQERIKDDQWKDVHGKTIRLSHIKRRARCKSKNDLLLQEMIAGRKSELLRGRLIRLSQMKSLARLKGKSTTEEGTKEHTDEHVHCNKFEGIPIEIASGKLQKKIQPKENIQRHLGSKESLGFIYECHQHIPKALSVQNNVLNPSFTKSPNEIFQQCDINTRWLLYMHRMQLKECHCIVAPQGRAECIKGKRASKDKHQYSEKPVQSEVAPLAELHPNVLKEGQDSQQLANSLCCEENSERKKESDCVKGRMRLTQLRREVRLGNQCCVRQGLAEN